MISDSLVAVLGTIGGSIVGGSLALLQSWIREKGQNRRHWTGLLFDHKYEALSNLLTQYNTVGKTLLQYKSVQEITRGRLRMSKEDFDQLATEHQKLLELWGESRIVVDDEENIRRGLALIDQIIRQIAEFNDFPGFTYRIKYDGDIGLEEAIDFNDMMSMTQDNIKQEIRKPVDQFRDG